MIFNGTKGLSARLSSLYRRFVGARPADETLADVQPIFPAGLALFNPFIGRDGAEMRPFVIHRKSPRRRALTQSRIAVLLGLLW